VAGAQNQSLPVVGFLSSLSAGALAGPVSAFRTGLQSVGYEDGKNVAVEFRWADGRYDQLPALAADLVRAHVYNWQTSNWVWGVEGDFDGSNINKFSNAGATVLTAAPPITVNAPFQTNVNWLASIPLNIRHFGGLDLLSTQLGVYYLFGMITGKY
jgi:hypothetical protein